MNAEDFRKHAYELIDWIIDYYQKIEELPVKSPVNPGDIYSQLPEHPPEAPESFEAIKNDIDDIILKGVTHWQHPSFHAYFNANSSFPSILGELLSAGLGVQSMMWDTSPAAAELEERVVDWLRDAMGMPGDWKGCIQDTGSTSTLCAILAAREKVTGHRVNEEGLFNSKNLVVYASEQAHSSIEKAVKIAGIGSCNLRKIGVDVDFAMVPEELEEAIKNDIDKGNIPIAVIASTGTTGSTAFDPVPAIGKIAQKYDIWLHIDAAYAGTAALCPEERWMNEGLELVDSYVFNPHKWMMVNFDCSVLWLKDYKDYVRTFEAKPEYLKSDRDHQVNNYKDWGIQLGRRFRSLKLWFVLRSYGIEGIREKIRLHNEIAKAFERKISTTPHFEILAPVKVPLVCFRYNPPSLSEEKKDQFNKKLMDHLNQSGKVYLTHTKLNRKFTLRAVFSQTNVQMKHADKLHTLLLNAIEEVS